jgi:Skp family chaperone for outer membrane proteins
MKKITIVLIGIALSSLLASSAFAGTRDHRVNHRQHKQHARIAQGVKSGELTKSEAKDLRGDQRELRQEEKAYKADGQLTKAERKDLHEDLNENSKEIYQEKHDAETRN